MCGKSCRREQMFCTILCNRNYRQGTPFIWTSWQIPFSDGLEFSDALRSNRFAKKGKLWKN